MGMSMGMRMGMGMGMGMRRVWDEEGYGDEGMGMGSGCSRGRREGSGPSSKGRRNTGESEYSTKMVWDMGHGGEVKEVEILEELYVQVLFNFHLGAVHKLRHAEEGGGTGGRGGSASVTMYTLSIHQYGILWGSIIK